MYPSNSPVQITQKYTEVSDFLRARGNTIEAGKNLISPLSTAIYPHVSRKAAGSRESGRSSQD